MGEYDMRLQDLSQKAQEALSLALDGAGISLESLRSLCQRDIWIMPNFGRKTSNEIRDWAARHGVTMPENNPPPRS